MPIAATDRECVDYLNCPECMHVDLDFEWLDYKLVRCSMCGTTVHVTRYEAFIGPPGDPIDHVSYIGVAA